MTIEYFDPSWEEQGHGTSFHGFQNLMRHRIRDVLLVSSLYDLYLFEEDGRLYELIRNEYQGLSLSHAPELTRVSSGKEAIALAKEERRFDLIITTLHIEDMNAVELARCIRAEGLPIPVVLLAFDNRELKDLFSYQDTSAFENIFVWQGDFRLIGGIIKSLEDRMNVDHDTRAVGVQSIIVIEDNVRYYSSFLPIIYTEILNHSQRLIAEGLNLSHKYLRMRARPKILLCKSYDEAWKYFEEHEEYILGVISDVDFQSHRQENARAGLEFARNVKARHDDIPILLQSNTTDYEAEARAIGCSFLLKGSPTLLHDLQQFMIQYFSFGDFVFRTKDGKEVGRAYDLRTLEEQLQHVPEESIEYHAQRNHFSNWLKARTEFWLAEKLRPRKVSDYGSVDGLRQDLIRWLRDYRRARQRGVITDFKKETFLPSSSFARIGGGSLGGKARGLGFLNILLNTHSVRDQFESVQVHVPPGVVIGTDVFDRFLDENDLRNFALSATNDDELVQRFLAASWFPEVVREELATFLQLIQDPLAVRSSSLLEDSQYYSFAGAYDTFIIPNSHPDPEVRLQQLLNAVKRVYASTFCKTAREYFRITSYRLEEEKMGVIIQKMVGRARENRFYPDFSGVAKSFNFYPIPPQKTMDGIVSVALGLGKAVVEGGTTVKFSPKYPGHLVQWSTPVDAVRSSQKEFFALDLSENEPHLDGSPESSIKKYPLEVAEKDGSLGFVGSIFSPENDSLTDGLSRKGVRVVTFAPILRNKIFPLPQIVEQLLELGKSGMGTPVEIEFAVDLAPPPGRPREFGVLQMRPLVLGQESDILQLDVVEPERLLCQSQQVMGNGIISDICDVVFVDHTRFDRARTQEVAAEVALLNHQLLSEARPYLLIGLGRWGSLDPWLGIPVKWEQISGARTIVETGFKELDVAPSQGSHFFQNISSFMIGYFTVDAKVKHSFLDWDWLLEQPAVEVKDFIRHIRFSSPLTVKIDGYNNKGIILKPDQQP